MVRSNLTLTYLTLIVLLVTTPAALAAQSTSSSSRVGRSPIRPRPEATRSLPPTIDSLAAITRRGRALAQHDQISWLAAGAISAPLSPQEVVRQWIAHKTENGWEVAVGQLSETGDQFLISTLARPGMQSTWASQPFDPPQPDSGYFARAGRAVATALVMFHPIVQRPHIATVVPAEDGPWWWVYIYPAPVQPGVWPRGGDMRFRVSADGRVITETRRLHDGITEYSVRTARSAPSAPDGRSTAKGDAPEDTDVFHILQRRPALPELMTAGRYRYRIDVDGRITLLGTR